MQRLKPSDHTLLTETVLKVLSQNRITTLLEFLQEDTEKLSVVTKLTLQQILTIRDEIFNKYSAPLINGNSLYVKSLITKKLLSTGIHQLDKIVGGGLPVGFITEICGLADSGKTQLCFQLAINCVRYSESTVLYVDTKGDFSAKRIQKILDAYGCSHKEMARILLHIKVVHVWTMEELIELFREIKNETVAINDLSLIIIDSLPCLMLQYLGDEHKTGLTHLNTLVNYSKFLCKEFNISMVCVNIQTRWVEQEVTDLEDKDRASSSKDSYIEKKNRCLGKYWENIPATILYLEKTQDKNEQFSDYVIITVTVSNFFSSKLEKCTFKISNLGVT